MGCFFGVINILLSFPLIKIFDWATDVMATMTYWGFGNDSYPQYGNWAVANWFITPGCMTLCFYLFFDIAHNIKEKTWKNRGRHREQTWGLCGYGFFADKDYDFMGWAGCLGGCSGCLKIFVCPLMLAANVTFFIIFTYVLLPVSSIIEWLINLAELLKDSECLTTDNYFVRWARRYSDENSKLICGELPIKRNTMVFWKLLEIPQMISCMAIAVVCYRSGKEDDDLGWVLVSAISSGIVILITIYQNIRLCCAVCCEKV